MKKLFTRLFGIMLLFGITATAMYAVIPQPGDNCIIPEPNEKLIKKWQNQIQAEPKKVVFFNNIIDPTGFQDNFYFNTAYWRHVNGDLGAMLYADDVEEMPFSDQTLASLKIMDHEIYFFPMGDFPLYATTQGGKSIINFINAALDSGKRVIIFGHNVVGSAMGNTISKDFITNTMGITDIGLKKCSSGNTIYPYAIMGKDYDPVGLNAYISCNAIGIDQGQQYPAITNYLDYNWFRSKDESKYQTFFYIGTVADKNYCEVTDSAVGIRTIMKQRKKSRCILWSVGSENIHFSYNSTMVIHASITWCLQNDIDEDGAFLDLASGDLINFGNVELKQNKIRNILLLNKGNQTLKLDSLEFIKEDGEDPDIGNIFYAVDDKGVKIDEKTLFKQKFSIEPGKGTSIKIKFEPKKEGVIYLRTLRVRTNEQEVNGSGIGRDFDISFFGEGGQPVYDGSHLSLNYITMDFGMVYTDSVKTLNLEVYNKGSEKLTISSFVFDKQGSDNPFEVHPQDINSMSKKEIEPGEFKTYRIRYHPIKDTTQDINALFIYSDAANYAGKEVVIPVTGSSERFKDTIVKYVDELYFPEGNFKIEVTPNPASESAIATYTWDKGTPSNLDMWLIDLNGNKVMSLLNTRIENGTGSVNINTSNIASGTYFILAKIRGKAAKIPLVIVK